MELLFVNFTEYKLIQNIYTNIHLNMQLKVLYSNGQGTNWT
jgi:hypothetical protein